MAQKKENKSNVKTKPPVNKKTVEEKKVNNKKPVKKDTRKMSESAKQIVKKVFKNKKKDVKNKPFEEKSDLEKLYLYIIIVDLPLGRTVEKLMQNIGSSMQFTHLGRGTASKEILNILGITDDSKAIVNAVVSESKLSTVKEELQIFFAASKKNRGVAFAIPFSAVKGVRMYKYLTQTI